MNNPIHFREATVIDVPAIARLCSETRQEESYWRARIDGYMNLAFNPHQATSTRLIYVAVHKGNIIGFIAGHLTRRTDYPGQIQWIATADQCRSTGVGSELLWILSAWFSEKNALGVRTDIDPENLSVQEFYQYHHASSINKYWLFWDDIRLVVNDHESSRLKDRQNDVS